TLPRQGGGDVGRGTRLYSSNRLLIRRRDEGGFEVVAVEAVVHQGFGRGPVEGAEGATADCAGLARGQHLVLQVAGAEFRTDRIREESQHFHPLLTRASRPVHIAVHVGGGFGIQ